MISTDWGGGLLQLYRDLMLVPVFATAHNVSVARDFSGGLMPKERLAAFSDGVIAIIITIMVLEMKAPHSADWSALIAVAPAFASYVLSFIYIGIYWNNHHHLLHTSTHVNGVILWANLHLLFWLSLVPFVTAWLGENHFAAQPTALYGLALLMPAIAYVLLQKAIIAQQGAESPLQRALGSDIKGKISPVLYVAAIGLSFVAPWAAQAIYVLVALMWLVPDRRIERALQHEHEPRRHRT
jgi:uncharacterized membrane protein